MKPKINTLVNSVPDPSTVAFRAFENSIYDLGGLLTMIEDLTLVQRSLFRDKEGTISTKAKDFTTSRIVSIFEDLEKTGVEPDGEAPQLKFIKDLIIYLKSLPVIKVTFAFAPTSSFMQKISTEISNILGKKAILDLVVDQYLIGGAIFEYKGKVCKQTLEGKLEEALMKQIGTAS